MYCRVQGVGSIGPLDALLLRLLRRFQRRSRCFQRQPCTAHALEAGTVGPPSAPTPRQLRHAQTSKESGSQDESSQVKEGLEGNLIYRFQSPGVGSRPGGRHARPAGGGNWGVTPLETLQGRPAEVNACRRWRRDREIIKELILSLIPLSSTLRGVGHRRLTR